MGLLRWLWIRLVGMTDGEMADMAAWGQRRMAEDNRICRAFRESLPVDPCDAECEADFQLGWTRCRHQRDRRGAVTSLETRRGSSVSYAPNFFSIGETGRYDFERDRDRKYAREAEYARSR